MDIADILMMIGEGGCPVDLVSFSTILKEKQAGQWDSKGKRLFRNMRADG